MTTPGALVAAVRAVAVHAVRAALRRLSRRHSPCPFHLHLPRPSVTMQDPTGIEVSSF